MIVLLYFTLLFTVAWVAEKKAAADVSGEPSALFYYYTYKLDVEANGQNGRIAKGCRGVYGLCNFDEFLAHTMTDINRTGGQTRAGKQVDKYVTGDPVVKTYFPDLNTVAHAKTSCKFAGHLESQKLLSSQRLDGGHIFIAEYTEVVQDARRTLENQNKFGPNAQNHLTWSLVYLDQLIGARKMENNQYILNDFRQYFAAAPEVKIISKTTVIGGFQVEELDLQASLQASRNLGTGALTTSELQVITAFENEYNRWLVNPRLQNPPLNPDKTQKDALSHQRMIQACEASRLRIEGPATY